MGNNKRERRQEFLTNRENFALNSIASDNLQEYNFDRMVKRGLIRFEPIPEVKLKSRSY